MGALDRVRRLVDRLPLGEAPRDRDGLRTPEDAKAELARTIDTDEQLRWAGWIYAARGAGPHDGLDESAGVVTDRRVVWVPLAEDLGADEERVGDIRRLMVDRKSRRLLLVTDERDEDSPELAVLFCWERDLHDAIQAAREAAGWESGSD
ncbi:MAG: hypothetical protein AAGA99_06095 [Actinomycetota bacterium]